MWLVITQEADTLDCTVGHSGLGHGRPSSLGQRRGLIIWLCGRTVVSSQAEQQRRTVFFGLWLGRLFPAGMEGRESENIGIPAFSMSKQREECEEEQKFAITGPEKKRADRTSLGSILYSLSILCN